MDVTQALSSLRVAVEAIVAASEQAIAAAEQSKLAAFLIGAGEGSYYLCGGWGSSSVPWFPIYDLPLGEPLSDAVLGADGVWSRSFKAGTNVTMDSKTQIGRIFWSGR